MIVTYTVEELVPILKKTEKTIRNYINTAELKASLIGGSYVIREEDVNEFLIDNQPFEYDSTEDEEENEEESENEEENC